MILAGDGIRIGGAAARFAELVRAAGVPVLTTRLAVDLLPYDDALCFGTPGMLAARYANLVLQNSDLLVAIGTRLDQNLMAYEPFPLRARRDEGRRRRRRGRARAPLSHRRRAGLRRRGRLHRRALAAAAGAAPARRPPGSTAAPSGVPPTRS